MEMTTGIDVRYEREKKLRAREESDQWDDMQPRAVGFATAESVEYGMRKAREAREQAVAAGFGDLLMMGFDPYHNALEVDLTRWSHHSKGIGVYPQGDVWRWNGGRESGEAPDLRAGIAAALAAAEIKQ